MNEYPDIERCKKIEQWMPRTYRKHEEVSGYTETGHKIWKAVCPRWTIPEMLEVILKHSKSLHLECANGKVWGHLYERTDTPLFYKPVNALADCIAWLGENGYIKEALK